MNEKIISLEFNNKTFTVKMESDKKIDVNLDDVLKVLYSEELFDYLYDYHKEMFDEINNDS